MLVTLDEITTFSQEPHSPKKEASPPMLTTLDGMVTLLMGFHETHSVPDCGHADCRNGITSGAEESSALSPGNATRTVQTLSYKTPPRWSGRIVESTLNSSADIIQTPVGSILVRAAGIRMSGNALLVKRLASFLVMELVGSVSPSSPLQEGVLADGSRRCPTGLTAAPVTRKRQSR